MRKFFLLSLAIALLFSCQSNETKETLSAAEFAEMIQSVAGAQIVDVRTQGEFKGGHIADASNIDISTPEFASMAAALDKDKPVFVYCLSGSRSAAFVTYLKDRGFDTVYDMPGGLLEWRRQDLPLIQLAVDSPGMSMEEYLALTTSSNTVLVDFYAEWCAPCKRMEPYISAISEELGADGRVIRIDVDQNSQLAKELDITGIPVLKYFKDNEEAWTQVGYIDEETLRNKMF